MSAELETRVATLEANQGDYSKGPYEGSNNENRPNGEATVVKSLHQLHEFADDMVGTPGVEGDTGVIGALQREIKLLNERVKTLEQGGANPPVVTPPIQPPANVEVPSDLVAALTALGFEFYNNRIKGLKLKAPGPKPQPGQPEEGDVFGYLGVDDGAFRVFYNICVKIGSVWPDYETNPNLPVLMKAFERDGGDSEDLIGSSRRKTHLSYYAGFLRGIGPRKAANIGKWIDEVWWEAGRGVRFNVFRPGGSEYGDIQTMLAFDAASAIVRVGDQLRRVEIGPDGHLIAGAVVDENE